MQDFCWCPRRFITGLVATAVVVVVLGGCEGDGPTASGAGGPRPYRLELPSYFPQPLLPADNPLTVEGVELGRHLFFDPVLSIDSTVACASCHLPEVAFSDDERFSEGVAGRTGRNSMPTVNLLWAERFFWDGRAPSLEAQALQPVADPVEMGENWDNVVQKLGRHPEYPALFEQAFGAGPITKEKAARAIAQFERTLLSYGSRFDRFVAGEIELSPLEREGFTLFNSERSDCFHCHGSFLATDNLFHNNGLDLVPADSGLAAVSGRAADLGKFKTPSLRNVAFTAPYMHDGRFETLEEVVDFYGSGIQVGVTTDPLLIIAADQRRGAPFSEAEKRALVAFMKTMSDPDFLDRGRDLSREGD
jgi:cytochrome c peroxidase